MVAVLVADRLAHVRQAGQRDADRRDVVGAGCGGSGQQVLLADRVDADDELVTTVAVQVAGLRAVAAEVDVAVSGAGQQRDGAVAAGDRERLVDATGRVRVVDDRVGHTVVVGVRSADPVPERGSQVGHRIADRVGGRLEPRLVRLGAPRGRAGGSAGGEPVGRDQREDDEGRGSPQRMHRQTVPTGCAAVPGPRRRICRSSPLRPPSTLRPRSGPLAQLAELRTFNPQVPGSSPGRPTNPCSSDGGRAHPSCAPHRQQEQPSPSAVDRSP